MNTQALAQTGQDAHKVRYGDLERFRAIESVVQLMPPRDNGRPEFTTLIDSVREMGILNPVVAIECEDGNLYVIDGYMRVMVARRLGLKQAPYIATQIHPADPAVVDLAARLNWSHRHLSDFEKVWVIGNHYLSEKQRYGGQVPNINFNETEWSSDHSVKTESKLAGIYHIGERTVRRYANMAKVCRSIIRVLAEQLRLSVEDTTTRFFDLWRDTERGRHVDLGVLAKISHRLVEYEIIDDPDSTIRRAFSAYAVDLDRFPKDSAAQEYALPKLGAEGLIQATLAKIDKELPPKKMAEQLAARKATPQPQPASGEYLPAERGGRPAEQSMAESAFHFDIPPLPEDSPLVDLIQQRAVQFQSGVTAMSQKLDDVLTAYVPQLTRLAEDLIHIMEEHWKEDFNSQDKSRRSAWEEIARFYRALSLKKGILLDVLESDRDAVGRLRNRLEKLAELAGGGMPEITRGLF
jgi:hypothetical protein